MMRAAGLCGALLIAVSLVLTLPDEHVLEAGAVVALTGAIAVLWRSPGLAIVASVVGLLVFSVVLLLAPPGSHVIEAVLLGIGLLILLEGSHFELRFRIAGRQIAADHLRSLGRCILLSAVLALLTGVVPVVMSAEVNASVRPIIAGFGGVLIVVAIVWQARAAGPR